MNGRTSSPRRVGSRLRAFLQLLAVIALALASFAPLDAIVAPTPAGAATCAAANIAVTPLMGSTFYTDFSPSPSSLPVLSGHYAGYRITNNTGSAISTGYVKLSGFTGGVVSLATGQASSEPLSSLAPGASGLAYFYLTASSATAAAQSHTIEVYDRRPDLTGAVQLCTSSFTYSSVTSTTQAAANKVTIATATSNPPGLGAIMTLTVTGQTGTIGSGPAGDPQGFDMTPAAVATGSAAWNPAAYRLVAAKVNVDLDGGGASDHNDYLHWTFTDPSSGDRTYVATYTFVIVGTTTGNTPVTPIQYIASGTQTKHTSTGASTYTAILPIQPISNTTTLAKSVNPTTLTVPGGTANYTVTATNSSGTQAATLDDFTDTPGTGAAYVAGSSKFNGVTISDPVSSGGSLVWLGAFSVPAGASRSLTYQMSISTASPATVSNSVVGHIGASQIDTSTTTSDDSPATSSVDVAPAPKINLQKSVTNRLDPADQFTVATKNGASTVASATTAGGAVSASTGSQTVASGTTYTLTDTMAAGSVSTIGQYASSITCSNSKVGSTTTLPSGSGTSFTVTPNPGDVITCTFTNGSRPQLTLVKSVAGRISAADQFTVAVLNGAVTVASATTSGSGSSATTGSQTLTAGTTYTLTDAMAAGSTSLIGSYSSAISCSNTASASGTALPIGAGTSTTITPSVGDVITCTYTNTPPAPTLSLSKAISSRFAASDQFKVAVTHGATTDASATTAGAGTTASTGATTLVPGTTYTLGESLTAGTSALADYASSISCTNSTPGTGTVLPTGAGQSFSITPAAGDVISCTLTNAAKPHITLAKSIAGRVVSGDQFTVAITHGATTDASASTSGAGTSATTGSQGLVAGTTYTLSESVAGGTSSLSDYLSSISCSNAAGGSATVLPSGSGTSFTITPAAADNITCTITNTAKPHLTLVKSVASRANAADQFTVSVKNGASTVAAATTSGAGTSATTGSQALTGGTAYTLTDAMAGGSASVIGQYASSIACTNTKVGSATALPSGSGTSFSVTPANGDNITCTITNTAGTASLALTKNASPSTGVTVGTVITYTYGVTNNGSLPLTNVTVTDPHSGLSAITCAPAQGSTLAAAATMSCSATYTVTQADVDAGSIINTGTVTAKDPSNNTVTQTAGKTVTATQSASLSLTKSASPNSGVVAGNLVTYTFSGKNTGSVTLHNVTVTDPMSGLSAVSCTPGTPATLAPNATISCTATYTVTQADVDAGSFTNTATIAGLDPSNNPVSGSGGTSVSALQSPSFSLTKSALPNSGVVAGNVVTYTFSGKNTGTVTLHNVTVTDPMSGLSAISCTPGIPATLAPNATISCTATYTVTQADVDAGSFSNTATIAGLTPANAPVTQTASTNVTANQVSSVALTKTASPNSNVNVGDVVTYSLGVTNTGTVTLHNVSVTDPKPGLSAIGCTPAAPATLAPNATMSCTATYTVTQADVDAGTIANTATVTGLNPANAPVTNTASTSVGASQIQDLTATKTAGPNTGVVAGDVVTYTITAHNAGTVTLSNVSVTDPMTGLSPIGCTPAAPATLAPNADIVCTATYTVTQADVDAGSIANTATAHGTFGGNTQDVPAGTTVLANQNSQLSVTKSAAPSVVDLNDTVDYTVDVQNTGTTTVDGVTVSDPMPGLSAFNCAPAAPASLAPGASMSCTATYSVTQADMDAGSFTNTATASGTDPNHQPVTASGSATVTANQAPLIFLNKSAAPTTGVVAGDVVDYTVYATNQGNVTLHNATVTDPMAGLSPLSCSPANPVTLAPFATVTCTASYTVTQVDVDAGSFTNTASVSGLDPQNGIVTDNSSVTVDADQTPDLILSKTATPSSGVVAGDVVTYDFYGQNFGTVTMHGVTVTDPMTGLSPITCTPATPATLAPGEAVSCSATYTVTQADVDAGSIVNTATISGLDPQDGPASGTGGATVTAAQAASLSLTKTASPNSGVVAGDTVTYSFHGQNTGTVSVGNVDVTDPMTGLSAITCTPGTPTTLAPGATIDCSATYTVTQADVDAGSFSNTATMAGTDPSSNPVSTTGSTTVTADQAPALSLTKTANPSTGVVAGDTVHYTMTASNDGPVTLHGVTVTDPMTGLSPITCTPAAPATLAPGATISCGADYTVTQADVDAGSFSNTATVTGLDPTNAPTSASDGATVTADQTAGLSFTKTASPTSGVVAGSTVTYSFHGQNTGTVSVGNVDVTDPMTGLSPITCTPPTPATLAPNATIDCSATYTVTQADVDAGSISNTATISGLDPGSQPVTQTAGSTVLTDQTASISLTKTASPTSGLALGDTVTYTMTATNTGAVSLHNVSVSDPMPGLSAPSCTPAIPATLASGASVTCTATYTVTQADVNQGSISNTATVDALDPANAPVTDSASRTVLTGAAAGLSLVKTATPSTGVHLGDVVTYDFAVTNSGGLTVHGVDVTDPLAGLSAITCNPNAPVALAPGDTADCSATYTVTQADVDAGTIVNTATVSGLDPAANPVTATDGTIVTTAAAGTPDATLSKKLQGVSGTTATWIITVTNSGTGALPGPFTVKDTLPDGLTYESAKGDGWDCTGTSVISCTHATDLAAGASTDITVTTTITGTGKITNVASLDVLGESITSNASVTPPAAAGGFAFTGADAGRYGLMGLLLLVGGGLLLVAARRRRAEPLTER